VFLVSIVIIVFDLGGGEMDEQRILLLCILILMIGILIYIRIWRNLLD
jgi:hypothetical protein